MVWFSLSQLLLDEYNSKIKITFDDIVNFHYKFTYFLNSSTLNLFDHQNFQKYITFIFQIYFSVMPV